jgi:hypothetical protein
MKAKEWGRVAGFSALRVTTVGVGVLGVELATLGLILPIVEGFTEEGEEPSRELTFADTKGLILAGAALTAAGGVLFTVVRAWALADGRKALQRGEAK